MFVPVTTMLFDGAVSERRNGDAAGATAALDGVGAGAAVRGANGFVAAGRGAGAAAHERVTGSEGVSVKVTGSTQKKGERVN